MPEQKNAVQTLFTSLQEIWKNAPHIFKKKIKTYCMCSRDLKKALTNDCVKLKVNLNNRAQYALK